MSTDYDKVLAALEKAVGGNDEYASIKTWLDTGFDPLNFALSGRYDGGFPGGRIVEIFGPESSGKTWLATQAMVAAQRAGGIAGFHDHERSFLPSVGEGLGLNTDPRRFFFKKPDSFEGSIATFIKAVNAIRDSKVIPDHVPLCWVFDSLPTMVPKAKMEKDVTDFNMNDMTMLARVSSQVFPAVANVAERTNCLVIVLNQIRLKPGVTHGDPTTTPGGNSLKFHATCRVQLGAKRIMADINGEKIMLGQDVTARVVKNKASRPYMVANWKFLFGDDGIGRFDVTGSLIDYAVAKKILGMSGSRVEWTDGKTYHRSVLAKRLEDESKVGELRNLIRASGVVPDEDKTEVNDLIVQE